MVSSRKRSTLGPLRSAKTWLAVVATCSPSFAASSAQAASSDRPLVDSLLELTFYTVVGLTWSCHHREQWLNLWGEAALRENSWALAELSCWVGVPFWGLYLNGGYD